MVDLIAFYEKNEFSQEASDFFVTFGQDLLWKNLVKLTSGGVSKSYLVPIIGIPEDLKLVLDVGTELADIGHLDLIEKIILDPKFDSDQLVLPLKLKLLSQTDESKFMTEIRKSGLVRPKIIEHVFYIARKVLMMIF